MRCVSLQVTAKCGIYSVGFTANYANITSGIFWGLAMMDELAVENRFEGVQKGHNSLAVANRFVDLSQEQNKTITIMQLVKFVYLAHGWHWGFYDEPLICDRVEAWKFGPVVPEVYFTFRPHGIVVKQQALQEQSPQAPYSADFSEQEEGMIDEVFRAYSKLSGAVLSALTHERDTPWDKTRGNGFHVPIRESEIREYYKEQVKALPEKS